jgi:hypothetical protein
MTICIESNELTTLERPLDLASRTSWQFSGNDIRAISDGDSVPEGKGRETAAPNVVRIPQVRLELRFTFG